METSQDPDHSGNDRIGVTLSGKQAIHIIFLSLGCVLHFYYELRSASAITSAKG